MHNPSSVLHFTPRSVPSRRYAAIAFVGLLHVGIIYALVTGLMPPVFKIIPHPDFDAHVIVATIEKPVEQPKPEQPVLQKPVINTVPKPVVHIAEQKPSPINVAPSPPQSASDSGPVALAGTHTTPPYPPISRRLGQEGVVQLRITIAPDGSVAHADVIQSSGWPELDEAASSWVVVHWRYQPATEGGVPVTSTVLAAVRFNLETAR